MLQRLHIWPALLAGACPLALGIAAAVTGVAAAAAADNPYLLPDGQVLGQSGRYVEIRGFKTYYEIHGQGEPLLLIHGDAAPIELWSGLLPILMTRYRVIVPERRGHYRTYDPPGPYSYEQFADDMDALLDALGVPQVIVAGHSGGAMTALQLAYRHPERVRRLVVMSGVFSSLGFTYEYYRDTVTFADDPEVAVRMGYFPQAAVDLYRDVSPMGPDHFPVFWRKIQHAADSSPSLAPADLARITIPVLVLSADRDWIRLDHTIQLFDALPHDPDPAADMRHRQLAVIPGSTHMVPYEKPDLVGRILVDFLAGH